MSYQVIALRWRPQTFAHMMGQNHVSQTLLNALKNQCLPQALLFTGLRGTGKTSAARILAKSMRCTNLKNHIPCGQCKECEDISLSRNLDVIEIDGASHNGVDSIRDLRNSVSFRPTTGHKKIYIIDEVHMLSSNAFNALLKTLEEPPEHVTFILATTEIHKIPKTILSRCHRFDFRKVPIREITNYLEHICKEENIKYEMQALWAISRQGEGSVRDALSFLDQVMVYSHCNITYLSVIESLGLTDRRLLMQILSNIVSQEVQGLIQNLDSIFSSGTDVGIFAEDFLEEIKNLLIIKNVGLKSDYLDLPEEEVQVLLEISQKISEAHIHLLFDMMLETTQMILRSQDPRTVLEVGLLKLCLYPQVFDMQKEALKNISSAQRPSAPTLSLQSQKKGQSIQNPVSSESGSSGSGSSESVSSERGSSESGSSESGSLLRVVLLRGVLLRGVLLRVVLLRVVLLGKVLLRGVFLRVFLLGVILLRVFLLRVFLLGVILSRGVLLRVVFLRVFLLGRVLLGVILLRVFLLGVILLGVVLLGVILSRGVLLRVVFLRVVLLGIGIKNFSSFLKTT